MTFPRHIAIDGPAGSGKSTLGKHLADALDYLFFDTGVMYRAVAWAALREELPLEDGAALAGLAERLQIDVRPPTSADGRDNDVLVDGEDVTWALRQPRVEAAVSAVAAVPGVRAALSRHQRRVGLRGRVVMVGRDIGTVVLPEADVKIYLDASAEVRARRRLMERAARGEPGDYQTILAGLIERDRIDSTRAVAPLRPAEDAFRIDSDGLNIEEVVAAALSLIHQEVQP